MAANRLDQSLVGLVRISGNQMLIDELFVAPIVSVTEAARVLGLTHAGARGILTRLGQCGIVERIEKTWPHLYVARELLDVIEKAELPADAGLPGRITSPAT